MDAKQFFTLSSSRENGFVHDLDEIRFGDAFYESILLRTGVLTNIRLGKNLIFVKQTGKPTHEQLVRWLLEGEELMTLLDLRSRIEVKLSMEASEKETIQLDGRSKHRYSPDSERVYVSREAHLNGIYE